MRSLLVRISRAYRVNPLRLLARISRAYGANPLHLLALLACFALTGYVASHLVANPLVVRIVIWFVAAVIAHDLVLFPLYALADRSVRGVLRILPTVRANRAPVVPPLNYVRTPALGAGLLLLLFLPGIIQQGRSTYLSATGQTQQPFLDRWLLLTGAMFAVSAVVYAVRSRRASAPFRAAAATVGPLLRRGERVLAIAYRVPDRIGAMCTTHALYFLAGDDRAEWSRIGWEDVADLRWQPDDGVVLAVAVPGAPAEDVTIRLVDPGAVVETGRTLVTTAAVVTVPLTRDTTEYGRITVRRLPCTEHLVWRVWLTDDVDPADADVHRQVDAALAAIGADLGVSPPNATTPA